MPALLVTHDFEEAAALADEIAVVESGRIVQRGTPGELASRPAAAFVADLIGSVVLTGTAAARAGGGTEVALDGGGHGRQHRRGTAGPVAVSVHPWEITLEPPFAEAPSSARNRIAARVASVTELGSRVARGAGGQRPGARGRGDARRDRRARPGAGREVVAVWKASATRVVERG